MNFNSKNLLITGGAGFIGSNFIRLFLNKYNNVRIINLDKLTYAGNLKNLSNDIKNNPNYNFIHGSIEDIELLNKIFKSYSIDGVINFAAESHVDNSIYNPDQFIKTNINGVFNLLKTCHKFWLDKPHKYKSEFINSRFHQVSTDEIYGSIEEGSFDELSKFNPSSPYSASKASADLLVNSSYVTYGLNTTISVCSNNFGPNQHEEKFIPKIIHHLINNKPIPVYGDGENVRDWLFVEDHCNAIELIFNKSLPGEIYNIGSNNEMSNNELIEIIHDLLKNKAYPKKKIKYVNDRFGHDFRYSISSKKLNKALGWKCDNNFIHNLEFTIDHILK